MWRRKIIMLTFILVVFSLLHAPKQITATQEAEDAKVYLPLVTKACPGIYGNVRENGAPASGIPLELQSFDGTDYVLISTQDTDHNGNYCFTNIPSLLTGQTYFVLFWNPTESSRLSFYTTRDLQAYKTGSSILIGSFDISDISLVSPENDTAQNLPVTFQWLPRPASTEDSYEFDLTVENYEYGDPYFYTDPPLGYVGSYTLNELPPGFSSNIDCVWEIWTYSPDGGIGVSFFSRNITFSSSLTMNANMKDGKFLGNEFKKEVLIKRELHQSRARK